MNPTRTTIAIGIAAISCLSFLACLPLLAAASGPDSPTCSTTAVATSDGTPTIAGQSTVTTTDLARWWSSTGQPQPPTLALSVPDFAAIYLTEAALEGIRGDLAFAQAVLETGNFTSRDTAINNFAGIAHYDGAPRGTAFIDPRTGVRAHIQLLKKYVAGNDAPLAHRDVSPDAGARAATWGDLAGTWASSPGYWTSLARVYDAILAGAGIVQSDAANSTAPLGCASNVGFGYALPVDRSWYDRHPGWFSKPHHDYPAIDIPVPTGTPVYAITNGAITSTPTGGRCGIGIVMTGDDGAEYVYCHGKPGSQTVRPGDRVTGGQLVMLSASTGRSTGPHLHVGIRVSGDDRCPQAMLTTIANHEAPPAPETLPGSGCTSASLIESAG